MPQLAAPEAVQADPVPDGLTPQAPAVESDFALSAPRVAVPEAEVAVPDTDTTPSTPPQTPDIATALTVPENVSNPELTAGLEEPLISRTVTSSPAVPEPEQDVVIATQPVQPAPAASVPDDTEVAGLAEDAAVVPQIEVPVAEPEDVASLVEESPIVVAPEPELAETVVDDTVAVPAPVPAVVAEAPVIVEPAPETEPVPEIVAVVPEVAPQAPEIDALPEAENTAPEPAPQVLDVASVPQAPLPQVNGGVRVNRLGTEQSETAGQDAEIVVADAILDDAPALERYAAVFENDIALPLIAILLVDRSGNSDAVDQVQALPFPVTVVLDALASNANAQMRAYRDAGIEVVMQTSLPRGAVPTDVEVAFEAAFGILPEAVALFSDGEGVLQNNRSVTEQVIQVLQSEGRGLIVVQRGLGNAIRGADQAGLPAATVLRDLDGAGESAATIGRALDQAAFRARQSGDAVLLARLTPETMTALSGWGTENDGTQVALAPVSAILRDGDEDE
jgi:polysaccharide deacetylase 2 family uncharacterized protein YibQ